jgi:hypothetical protein
MMVTEPPKPSSHPDQDKRRTYIRKSISHHSTSTCGRSARFCSVSVTGGSPL